MTAKFFVDTNVLLYAGSNAAEDRSKRQAARALLARPDIVLSAQVLQEFYAVAVAKQRLQMTHDEALAVLRSLTTFPVCPITRQLNDRARFCCMAGRLARRASEGFLSLARRANTGRPSNSARSNDRRSSRRG